MALPRTSSRSLHGVAASKVPLLIRSFLQQLIIVLLSQAAGLTCIRGARLTWLFGEMIILLADLHAILQADVARRGSDQNLSAAGADCPVMGIGRPVGQVVLGHMQAEICDR